MQAHVLERRTEQLRRAEGVHHLEALLREEVEAEPAAHAARAARALRAGGLRDPGRRERRDLKVPTCVSYDTCIAQTLFFFYQNEDKAQIKCIDAVGIL